MQVMFEEAGQFQVGRLMSEAESSAQVELATGKRVKVKLAHVMLRFEKPAADALLAQAHEAAAAVDLSLSWECAPQDEFGFADLAREYFGAQASATEQAAMLVALHSAPHYFRRAGKGRFKKASAEVLQQALAAIERKKLIAAQIEDWAAQLQSGQTPEPIKQQLYKILFKPDKNGAEYKAVVLAAQQAKLAPMALLRHAGAIGSAYEFHWQRFVIEHFPKGTAFAAGLAAPDGTQELPLATVRAYSIDDSATTEIDDALSVAGVGSGTVTVGIHIAAPSLAIETGSALDELAKSRLSTVYMPGHKITMLPDAVVQHYTLQEGKACPAISIYAEIDEGTLELRGTRSAIERVHIAANLRYDQIDHVVNEEWLTAAAPTDAVRALAALLGDTATPALHQELSFLFRWSKALKAERERVRGKPENFNRPDFNFKVLKREGSAEGELLRGDEPVQITTRKRGAPLDLIVAEAMIFANSQWGAWLGQVGVPAIYRSQASLSPGVKVRMGTKALPHAGMGVGAYAWSTSPLRRYTDLVNQWQIVSVIRHGSVAALQAPFKPKDVALMGIVSAFDAAYTAYNQFQAQMERYWTLAHLRATGVSELAAVVVKDQGEVLVRASEWPLVLTLGGTPPVARGQSVRVALGEPDFFELSVSARFLELLTPANADESAPEPEDEDDAPAATLQLAVDVADAQAAADPAAPS